MPDDYTMRMHPKSELYKTFIFTVKDLKSTHRPETGNLYPGSIIDTIATVQPDGDRSEQKRRQPKSIFL